MAEIMAVLAIFGEVEWYRLPSLHDVYLHPELKVFPPFVTWRYRDRDAQLAARLAKAIASFKGSVEWSFDDSRKNWLIYPSSNTDSIERKKLAETNPEYGIKAYNDLPHLAEHILTSLMESTDPEDSQADP